MNVRSLCLSLVCALAWPAHAGEGLVAPAADELWPQWQARITVQTATLLPLAASHSFDAWAPQRGVQGGALFGDYYFAKPAFGSFRASGGLMVGPQAGLPMASAAAGSRLGLAVNNGSALVNAAGSDAPGALPYLGVGFTGTAAGSGLAITADFGLVAEHPGAAWGVGRSIFGSQALDGAVRDLRLSPVLQLGVRYTF